MTDLYKQPTKFFKADKQNMQWYVFDAKGKTLGRLSSEIAKVLRGKHKPQYTPNMDQGDGVIVINAKEIYVSGSKAAQKIYFSHSGRVGNLKETPYKRVLERHPERIIEKAVRGMMPKNKLGRAMYKKLQVFGGSEHNMQAQKPITVAI